MLTLEKLKEMSPGIFASGEGISNITGELSKWVAVRGKIHDWAIYMGPLDWSYERVAQIGNKVYSIFVIKDLVPCDMEALNMYRL